MAFLILLKFSAARLSNLYFYSLIRVHELLAKEGI